jgi:hypothetical protein
VAAGHRFDRPRVAGRGHSRRRFLPPELLRIVGAPAKQPGEQSAIRRRAPDISAARADLARACS